ncbi:MAG: hypothetical protein A2147_00650 [Chloroflexi bacterium RBG_16_57_8]|nr:MAG: hypothetical protein A2147_00650 [Chloroflexi bacterium RBG_16_57_8]
MLRMKWAKLISVSVLAFVVLFLITYHFENNLFIDWFPEVVVAWGTLVLAYATFELGRTTVRENKIIREENERIRNEESQAAAMLRIRQWVENSLRLLAVTPMFSQVTTSISEVTDEFERALREIVAGILGARADAKKLGGQALALSTNAHDKLTEVVTLTRGSASIRDEAKLRQATNDLIEALNDLIKVL